MKPQSQWCHHHRPARRMETNWIIRPQKFEAGYYTGQCFRSARIHLYRYVELVDCSKMSGDYDSTSSLKFLVQWRIEGKIFSQQVLVMMNHHEHANSNCGVFHCNCHCHWMQQWRWDQWSIIWKGAIYSFQADLSSKGFCEVCVRSLRIMFLCGSVCGFETLGVGKMLRASGLKTNEPAGCACYL